MRREARMKRRHQATEPEHVADQRERILRWLATRLGPADLEAAS
jgi:hypothetical protein